jgi:hypothetical protein
MSQNFSRLAQSLCRSRFPVWLSIEPSFLSTLLSREWLYHIIQGQFRGMANQVTEQNIQVPLVKLFEVVDLQNQALEKLQIELEKLTKK